MPAKNRPTKKSASVPPIAAYDAAQPSQLAAVCKRLRAEIERALPGASSKVWHGAPVWFVGETPVAGYNVSKQGDVVLLFWNGQAFGDPSLRPIGSFHAAEARYASIAEIDAAALKRWLKLAGTKLWDLGELRARRKAATSRKATEATRKTSTKRGRAADAARRNAR